MDLSIIIATHNRLELTEQCLESLDHSVGKVAGYEIIIVDDCSTDGTREYLAELPPPYRVHLNEKKGNYAINNNRGAGLAQSDNLLFLNNDTSFESDFISPMMDGLDGLPDAGCIGNVQRIPATGRYDHFGVCFPKWHTPIHFGQHFVQKPELEGPYSRWAAVTAACMLVRKDIFFSVGGFDERYVNGCEDMDLCLKLHRAGYSHYVAHESEIFHHKGASPGRKDFNDQNLKIFKREWASYLEENVCPRDQKLAARSYLRSCWSFPTKTNLHKFSLSLRAAIKRSDTEAISQPECCDLP